MGEVACAGANRVVALKADGFKVDEKLRVGDWRPCDLVGDEVHADYLKVKVRCEDSRPRRLDNCPQTVREFSDTLAFLSASDVTCSIQIPAEIPSRLGRNPARDLERCLVWSHLLLCPSNFRSPSSFACSVSVWIGI